MALQNIKLEELLGRNSNENNYAVSSNWRIDFTKSEEFSALVGNDEVLQQMSYACTSDFNFQSDTEFATANVKGMVVSQAVWVHRDFDGVTITILESMSRRVEDALLRAQSKGTKYLGERNVAEKFTYTFSGIQLLELGNNGDLIDTIFLDGVQIQSVKLGTFTSGDSAEIVGTELTIKGHGWHKASEE